MGGTQTDSAPAAQPGTTPVFTARAHITGGRDGRATTERGYPELALAVPAELGGKGGAGPEATNPEELFAMAYGACFLSALCFLARQQKLSAKAFELDSTVVLGQEVGGAMDLAVELRASLPGVDHAKAAELMHAAHDACPYSRATRGNVPVRLLVDDEPV
jgi:osmotically inducible protein OsmC